MIGVRCPTGAISLNGAKMANECVLPAGRTVSQALEAQRIKLAELAATEVGILQRYKPSNNSEPEPMRLTAAIRRYLDQIDTLKKPNTYRKYDAVLTRFDKQFPGRELQQISIEELNEFVIKLRKSGLSPNTVLHNVIIVAQFCRRNGRPNLTRELQLPEAIHFLPKVYSEEQQSRFLEACDSWERALFSTFLFTGFREQEVMYLFWKDLNPKLRTVRVVMDWSPILRQTVKTHFSLNGELSHGIVTQAVHAGV
ncbi:MAG TPA: hypothetical protein VG345_00505 [Bryobacteraceae bacterium]|nr:hypothetical protein [Bryobacteraceae bacterium]